MNGSALASVVVLWSLGCASRPTVVEGKTQAEWVALLKSPDHKTRVNAADTLGMYFGPDAAPEILELLAESQAGTRSAAASPDVDARLNFPMALACVGEAARAALPRLRELQESDPEGAVRENAAKAIEAIESGGQDTQHGKPPSAWWCR